MRTSPSVGYVPYIAEWWQVITEAVRASFVSVFNDVDPSVPILLLATSDTDYKRLPAPVCHCAQNFVSCFLPNLSVNEFQ